MSTIRIVAIAAIVLGKLETADAQNAPKVDLSGEYAVVHDSSPRSISNGTTTLPIRFYGWFVSGGVSLTPLVAVVGEAGENLGAYHSGLTAGYNVDLWNYEILVGPRVSIRRLQRLAVFGQVLVGTMHSTTDISTGIPAFRHRESHAFAFQPGGGIDYWFARHLALRGGFDWRLINFVPRAKEMVLHTGVVVGM